MRMVAGLLALLGLMQPGLAAPRAELWPRWQAHDEASTAVIDQRVWASFLRRHVRAGADGINRVDYAGVSAADRAGLAADLRRLQQVPVSSLSRGEQRAFWSNLYNELTVSVVLQHDPVASIREINLSPGLFSASGPWDAKLIQVEGQTVSLNDIEHRILRPIWRDPRTHYALNCASLGCPNLRAAPYDKTGMEAQLDQAARDYVNSPRGFFVRDGGLYVSSIYEWYQADFGGTDRGVIEHLKRYAAAEKRRSLQGIRSISGDHYDWALNGTSGAGR